MFALRVDLLSGRYVATSYNDRDRAEWPPHPARVFSALVAAYAEHEPNSLDGEAERRALAWLETQAAPVLVADLDAITSDLGRRTVCDVFVPVNDSGVISQPTKQRSDLEEAERELLTAVGTKQRAVAEKAVAKRREALAKRTAVVIAADPTPAASALKEAHAMVPEGRTKQARTFPSVTPVLPEIELHWRNTTLPEDHRFAMDRLAGRVARLGHSSSFVSIRVVEPNATPAPDRVLEPQEGGEVTLRWVSPGQTERLIAYHQEHQQVEPRVMPCTFVSYGRGHGRGDARVVSSVFDAQWIVLARVEGPRLPITGAVGLAKQMNRALQSAFGARGEVVPELVSGHHADGAPSEAAHLAVVPLPYVGSEFADGALIGIALVLPRKTSPVDRQGLLRALASLENEERLTLRLGEAGEWVLERVGWEPPRQRALLSATWTSPATEWISATPIALDANPGDLHHPDVSKRSLAFLAAESCVGDAAERIGLPRPSRVEVSRSVLLQGAAKPRTYPRYPSNKDRTQRVLVHARVIFDEPVRGPVLLGAGRYLGLGLCRPIRGGFR